MKYAVLIACMVLCCLTASAQPKPKASGLHRHHRVEAPAAAGIYTYVEQAASFRGDVTAYIRNHLRYPDDARESGSEGKVEVLFEICLTGVVKVISLRSHSGSPSLDAEARRVVAGMPPWSPAKKNGVAVRTLMQLPVIFRLD